MLPSCQTCPSYVEDQSEQATIFGRAAGAPMCARFGHVLGHPGMSPERLSVTAQAYGSKCSSLGEDRPSTLVELKPIVVNPDPDVLAEGLTGKTCNTCRGCENMLRDDEVQQRFGYAVPVCKAKGTLIFKPTSEARGCGWASPGTPTTNAGALDFIPQLQDGFTLDSEDVIASMVAQQDTTIEPSEYKTDKAVTPEEALLGYRAWRKVVNPDNPSQYGYLPIFDPEFLTDEEALLIPKTGSEEHPELYVDYFGGLYDFTVEAFELDETPLLIGQPGVGKTEFARWIAYLMQVPFHRYQLGKFSEVDDLIGTPQYDPQVGTYFKEGRLPKAWGRPGVICADEIANTRGEIREFFRPLTDNSKQFVLDADHGLVKERHHACFLMFTMNPPWDVRNAGAEDFAAADANRLTPIWLDNPPEAVERHIIQARCKLDGYDIPKTTLDNIMKISEDIRRLCDEHVFPDWWGTRQTIKVARKTRWYSLAKAFKRASLDFYEPETVDLVLQSIQSFTGEKAT